MTYTLTEEQRKDLILTFEDAKRGDLMLVDSAIGLLQSLPVQEARMPQDGDGVTTAPAPTALDEWSAICEYAPATIMEGRKYLMLSEQACVRLGTALERTSGVEGKAK